MKSLTTLVAFCFIFCSSWAQECSDVPNCEGPTTYFLDIDGDGVGVNFEGTNYTCCCCTPSEMYVTVYGDPDPHDPKIFGESNITLGCMSYQACNYNVNANRNDNTCVFPKACQSCALDGNGNKVVDGTGEIAISNFPASGTIDANNQDNFHPCDCEEQGDGTYVKFYKDATGTCRKLTDPDFCEQNVDSDGLCDVDASGQIIDVCTANATDVKDDCGDCVTPGSAAEKLYISDDNQNGVIDNNEDTSCSPGTEDCILKNTAGFCNCEGDVFDNCGVCGGDGASPGYNCDGTCIDVSPENGVCDFAEIDGCQVVGSCNYNPEATMTVDVSCLSFDACGVCDGPGVPDGACEDPDPNNCYFFPEEYHNCLGPINDEDNNSIPDELDVTGCMLETACNYLPSATTGDINVECILKDELDVCGGNCISDDDNDGICDLDSNGISMDTCDGSLDECGQCEGGKVFTLSDGTTPCVPGTPGCTTAEGHCDCNGSTFDAVNSCGGNCLTDADNDGICDEDADGNFPDRDVCISGVYDLLGNCIEAGDTPCQEDLDGDGLCDHDTNGDGLNEDPCPNQPDNPDNIRDVCGVCNGPGIPNGDCDCNGSQLDAVDVCGGNCIQDEDNDGICDLDSNGNSADDCFTGNGQIDDCGTCNGSSYFTLADDVTPCDPGTPGCTNDASECNCQGDTLDIIGVCGGNCTTDADEDGICDSVDECIGEYDDCGECNGTNIFTHSVTGLPCEIGTPGCVNHDGECDCNQNVFDDCEVCGGNGIPDGACDCDGNKPLFGYDCNGVCLNDNNDNGICDELEEMEITQVLHLRSNEDSTQFSMFLDHVHMQQALDSFEYRHNLMAENLDDLSLTGHTMNVTIQKSITDKGVLNVKGLSTFNKNMYMKASLNLSRNMHVTGSLTVNGSTLSRSGLITSNMSVAGNASVGGKIAVGAGLFSFGRTELKKRLDISDDFTVFKRPGADTDTVFAVEASSGDVLMRGDLIGNSDLNITGHSEFDRLTVSNLAVLDNAIVDGQFRVNGNADLLGSLDVGDGVFTVNSFTGNTEVERDFNIGRNLFVHGNTIVQGKATIGGTTFANGGIETTWLEVLGDMNVAGEGRVGLNMSVGNGINVYKDAGVNADFEIVNAQQSPVFQIASATGNTVAAGNVDVNSLIARETSSIDASVNIQGNLNTLGTIDYSQNITVGSANGTEQINLKNAVFGSSLSSSGQLTTAGTFKTTGNVKTKAASITGGSTTLKGPVNINTNSSGNALSLIANRGGYAAVFRNTNARGHGILLTSGYTNLNTSTNFATFQNSQGIVMGRIEGNSINDWYGDGDYVYTRQGFNSSKKQAEWALANSIFSTVIATCEMVSAGADLASEASAVSTCAGNGVCASIPVPSLIALSVANMVVAVVAFGEAIAGTVAAGIEIANVHNAWNTFNSAVNNSLQGNKGVTYQSGAGDYAEWLPKAKLSDTFESGQVIGVHDGRISLNTKDADHVFVVSTLPVVLGNVPENTVNHEKVAFLGQVPVNVLGQVKYGDFIVASGNSDGNAIAKNAYDLTSSDFPNVIGVAWDESRSPKLKKINTAIGMNNGLAQAAETIESQIERAELKTSALKEIAFSLMKGEKPEADHLYKAGLIPPILGEVENIGETNSEESEASALDEFVVFEMTDDGMEIAFDRAMEQAQIENLSEDHARAWEIMAENEDLKSQFLNTLKERINHLNRKALIKRANYFGSAGVRMMPAAELVRAHNGSKNNTINEQ
jgi:hypothetical protein